MNTKIEHLNLSETRHRVALSILLGLQKSPKSHSQATIDFTHRRVRDKIMSMFGETIVRSEFILLLRLAKIRIHPDQTLGLDGFAIVDLKRRLSRKRISKNLDRAAELLTEIIGVE